uniref:Transmembrane protein n=1 Tax=Heterorhabditis bacteriophora TaxID=37862 RepID=A0A1I7W683_HETBA
MSLKCVNENGVIDKNKLEKEDGTKVDGCEYRCPSVDDEHEEVCTCIIYLEHFLNNEIHTYILLGNPHLIFKYLGYHPLKWHKKSKMIHSFENLWITVMKCNVPTKVLLSMIPFISDNILDSLREPHRTADFFFRVCIYLSKALVSFGLQDFFSIIISVILNINLGFL